jgi:uncharacterized protein
MAQLIRTYYDEAKTQLHEEYYEVDGKKEGVYKRYYDNGQLWEECNYVNGKLNGEYKQYHDNGQLEAKCNYVNGETYGESVEYFSEGTLFYKFIKYPNYREYEEYNGLNGKIKRKFKYENGEKIYDIEYDKNGNVMCSAKFNTLYGI